jgi:hypothetical protein
MAIHLWPPVARRLVRPTRGLGSAPLPRRTGLRPPTWPCSGWSLPRFTPSANRRHRHCGTGPRLAAGGRYPPPCAVELGLSSRRRTGARPSASCNHANYPCNQRMSVGRCSEEQEPTRFPKAATATSTYTASLYPLCSLAVDVSPFQQDSHDRFLATLWFALAIAGFDLA